MFTAFRILVGFVAGSVVGIVLREGVFVLAVGLLATAVRWLEATLALLPWTDPVYTHAALHSLGDIQVSGLALLHEVDLAVLRTTLEPGSSVLGRLAAAGLAHGAVLSIGLLLLRAGVHRRSIAAIVASAACQLQVAAGIVTAPPSLSDLETIGLSFAVNATLPSLGGRRLVVSDLVSTLPPEFLQAALVAVALVSAFLLAAVLAGAAVFVQGAIRRLRLSGNTVPGATRAHSARRISVISTACLVGLSALAAACVVTPWVTAGSESPVQAAPAPLVSPVGDTAGESSGAGARGAAGMSTRAAPTGVGDRWYAEIAQPSRVEVVATSGRFEYLVNGIPQVIRGMGVNTQYTHLLSPSERRARLDADMSEMQALGVNTLVGWDAAEFDGVLLDSAQRHGIGVVLPFDLKADVDYTDRSVRATLTQQVLAWVDRYRHYPALRMWGLGNEVLHKIVHPAWVGPQDSHQAAEARAFSDWLVETADAIHAADPDHPVTYRDAEDAFVGWISRALERHPSESRTWFVYGTNCYQDYLGKIVDNWPDQGTGVALWVSEFAPGGLAIPDRPDGFRQMWSYVRKHPKWVLGGAVYAWTRNGPEEIDRNLGLTDDGEPADRHSLDTIGQLFNASTP